MPKFGTESARKLSTAHPRLQDLFNRVVQDYDCKILYGVRTAQEQKELVAAGKSKTLNSKHLLHADGFAHAVDVSPYPIPDDWGEGNYLEKAKFYNFAGYVLGTAIQMGIEIRWGGDWDQDLDFDDQTFMDLVHFELKE